ncbi:archease [Mycobacterium sp.]|uniref:archease n=1 Tax=Mycobacterium sp. TaxID=1785 RepID=UPI002D3AB582|nr:archease [Mycobacterium sp.]HZA10042.1 archease [Mycobacterium sp.]
MPERGHRTVPHPADVIVEAWGPTRSDCLAEAVLGLVGSFADTTGAPVARTVVSDVTVSNDRDRLVGVLDEVIYVLDTQGLVPLGADVDVGPNVLRLRMPVASIDDVEVIGAAPKAVTLSGLEFNQTGDTWRCRATIDV